MARLVDITAVAVLAAIANSWFLYQFFGLIIPWYQESLQLDLKAPESSPPALPERAPSLIWYMLFVLIAIWGAYEVPAIAHTGQTFGKRLFGIRVIRLDDEQIGVRRSMRRWLNMSLPTLTWCGCCGLGIAFQIFDAIGVVNNRPYRQCIHDRIAQTFVVNVREGDLK
jgi:uncharacterized RDD family membrane protein YckC